MERIKKYFTAWDLSRIIKVVLAVALGIGYLTSKESLYLMGAVFLGAQAIFNIGCPGGSCATPPAKNQEQVVKVKEYKPEKK